MQTNSENVPRRRDQTKNRDKGEMPSDIPETMRALVAPRYCWPSEWEVAKVPTPKITGPDDVLIRMHAAGIATGDTLVARGVPRWLIGKNEMPLKIGIEGAGVVAAVGSEVTAFKPGDEVYAFGQSRPMNFLVAPGFCAEFAVAREPLVLRKPEGLSFEGACHIANVVTALQAIDMGLEQMRENGDGDDGLRGKTAFVPAALSATGSAAIQLLKNVYGARKIISTVSTAKLPLVEERLPPGLVDQVVDYTRGRLTDAVPRGSVDFVYNTQWGVTSTFALADPEKGVVASIASVPTPGLLRQMMPPLPAPAYWLAGLAQLWYAFCLRGTRVRYFFHSGEPARREDLERAARLMAQGKVRFVGRVVDLDDVEAVRREAHMVATRKGGIGKLVVKIV
ncbi:hypothetical protein AAE478_009706 [Parahypoxylon ruwenzoriense]